ncbi:MAG: hypothetical protein ACI9EF_000079 [Pseudohongiellaceae bacterium]|jgi:hypothetical protein
MTSLLLSVLLTAAVLALVIWSGASRRRSLHYGTVVMLFGVLTWAIYEAELYGQGLVFSGAAEVVKYIHFGGVAIVFLSIPVLVVTGVRLAKDESMRPMHLSVAKFFVSMVLVTSALGTAMTVMAEPLAQ